MHGQMFIKIKQAAGIIGVSPGRVQEFVRQKRLKSYQGMKGATHLFIRKEVEAFAKIPRKAGNPHRKEQVEDDE